MKDLFPIVNAPIPEGSKCWTGKPLTIGAARRIAGRYWPNVGWKIVLVRDGEGLYRPAMIPMKEA